MNWDRVHPKARVHFQQLEHELVRRKLSGECRVLFSPFSLAVEPNWDTPQRYGLGIFFRGVDAESGWSDDDGLPWGTLHSVANQRGLVSGGDKSLIIHPLWYRVRDYLS